MPIALSESSGQGLYLKCRQKEILTQRKMKLLIRRTTEHVKYRPTDR